MAMVWIGGNGNRSGCSLWLWCPGCEDMHRIVIDQPTGWTWDGNRDAPTINPSIKTMGVQWDVSSGFHKPTHHVAAGQPIVCHAFVRAGRWQFLADCTHTLAGTTVPMVPIPDDLINHW